MSGALELRKIDEDIYLMWTTEYYEPEALKGSTHFIPESGKKWTKVINVEKAFEYASEQRPYVYRVIVKH